MARANQPHLRTFDSRSKTTHNDLDLDWPIEYYFKLGQFVNGIGRGSDLVFCSVAQSHSRGFEGVAAPNRGVIRTGRFAQTGLPKPTQTAQKRAIISATSYDPKIKEDSMGDTKSISISRLIARSRAHHAGRHHPAVGGRAYTLALAVVQAHAGGGGAHCGHLLAAHHLRSLFCAEAGGGRRGRLQAIGKAIGFAVGSLLVFVAGAFLFGSTINHPNFLTALALLLMLGAAFVPGLGWRSLGNTLVAYAFAARIPVLIVMYFAMHRKWRRRMGNAL